MRSYHVPVNVLEQLAVTGRQDTKLPRQ